MSTGAETVWATTDKAAAATGAPAAAETQAEKYYIVENQTARSLQVARTKPGPDQASLIIPPFSARRISVTQYQEFDFQRWEGSGLITKTEEPAREQPEKTSLARRVYIFVAAVLIGVGLLGVILPGILDGLLLKIGEPTKKLLGEQGINAILGIQVILRTLFPLFLLLVIAAPLAVAAIYLARHQAGLRQGGGTLALGLVAISVIAVAAIGPVLIMATFNAAVIPITGRMLQMIFVTIAALLPALLYFLYDRQKVSIVSKSFYREIVLLDPAIHTSTAAREKYGHLINEVYGDKSAGYYLANVGLPIMLSSVLIALGWLLILLPINPADSKSPAEFFTLVSPPPTALSFGFLGAYFFALNLVFRRYVRSDLTPKAYSHITVRLLVTTILVWAVSILFAQPAQSPVLPEQSSVLLIMAFCIGVVPETGIKVIQEFMRKTVSILTAPLDDRDPLTKLEGIDLYDRARLSEEGVDNIENLAYHNLIELLVQTRIPARRLADMVDQAILYLRLRDVPLALPAKDKTSDDRPPALKYLRGYGIRTATDLMHAWRTTSGQDSQDSLGFKAVLEKRAPEFAEQIEIIVNTLKEADWIPQLQYRRAQVTYLTETPVENPQDFFKNETTGAGWRDTAATADGIRQAAPKRVGKGSDQIVVSAPAIEASATLPATVETIEPHT